MPWHERRAGVAGYQSAEYDAWDVISAACRAGKAAVESPGEAESRETRMIPHHALPRQQQMRIEAIIEIRLLALHTRLNEPVHADHFR